MSRAREQESPKAAGVLAHLTVLVGSPSRDGRATTAVEVKSGVQRVFWKRGRWRVRLEQWTPGPVVFVELQPEDKVKMVTTILDDEISGPRLVRIPKFQPTVSLNERMREVEVTIWESFDVDSEDLTVRAKPAVRSRVSFSLAAYALPAASPSIADAESA